MPNEAVASCQYFGNGTAVVDGEMEVDQAVTSVASCEGVHRCVGGECVKSAMPGNAVARHEVLNHSVGLADAEMEGYHTVAAKGIGCGISRRSGGSGIGIAMPYETSTCGLAIDGSTACKEGE